eukprot:TRINITY_DN5741_c0_g1_i5.p1 TRINITY_DN5741_c0_g1~~TRINITY_DN5741_c0_g1_i5.p1  ORF type:complete len:694 (-),score=77.39 TRINITY_DN5741_c0_g1_i5:27-1817(-)
MSSVTRTPSESSSEGAQSGATSPSESLALSTALVAAGGSMLASGCEGAAGQESSPPRLLPQSGEASQFADMSDRRPPLRGDHLTWGAAHFSDEKISAIPTAETDFPLPIVEEFLKTWRLDSRCHELILKICKTVPPEKLVSILRDCDASWETQKAKANSMVYVRSRLRRFEAKSERGDLPSGVTAITEKDEIATDVAALEEFCNRWSLSKLTRSYVKKLSPPIQHTLLQTFDPQTDTRNVDGMLFACVRNRIAENEKGPLPKSPDVRDVREAQAFCDKYVEDFSRKMRLDGDSIDVVREFPKQMPEASWADPRYPPGLPAGSRNTLDVQGGDPATLPPRNIALGTPQKISEESLKSTHSLEELCDRFATTWQLDARRRILLDEFCQDAPEDEFRRLLTKFRVSGETLHIRGKVMKWMDLQRMRFAARRKRALETLVAVSEEELVSFFNHWAFSDPTQRAIRSLLPQILRTVVDKFKPPADTKFVDGKVYAFMRLQRQKAAVQCLRFAGYDELDELLNEWDWDVVHPGLISKIRRDGIIKEFTEIWGLSARSVALLQSMTRAKIDNLVAHFAPAGKSDDMDKTFSDFVFGSTPVWSK